MAFGLQFQLLFNPPNVYSWVCSESHRAETRWSRWRNSGLVPFQPRSDPKQKTTPTLSLCSLQLSSRWSPPHRAGLSICFQFALQFAFSLGWIWRSWELSPLVSLFLLLRRADIKWFSLSQCIGFGNNHLIGMFSIKGENLGVEFWSTGNAKKPLVSTRSCSIAIRSPTFVPAAWFSFHPPGKKH